jgi:endonuclease-3
MARSVTTVTRRPAGGGRARKAPDAIQVVERLARVFPGATTELRFTNAFELLTATILSAQSTDARVNQVSPVLFARFPDARALAAADAAELERLIKPTGFFRAKSRALIGMASQLVARHAGRVPASMDELVALTGVGRKTANVVLGHALGVPGLPVDRHVLRVANRLGIARAATPEGVEAQLCAALPDRLWTLASDCLILHGRRVCRPRPLCEKCVLSDVCVSANLVAPVTGRTRPAGAPTPASPRKSARRGGAPRSRKAR